MTRTTTRTLLAACLGLALTGTAGAATDRSEMELEIIRQGDDVIAAVLLSHRFDLPLFVDLTYTVNGQRVKVEPVQVYGPTVFTQVLGPPDRFYSVCASYSGIVSGSPGESAATFGLSCDVRFPDPSVPPARTDLLRRVAGTSSPTRRDATPPPSAVPEFASVGPR